VGKREDNLRPGEYKLTLEEQKKGGIVSGKVRKEKATMRKSLEMLLNSNINIDKIDDNTIIDLRNKLKLLGADTSKMKVEDLVNAGLILGAVFGNANNYKTIIETKGELLEEQNTTPTLKLEVVDNSNLNKVLYEENQSKENAN
jgi:hypothetical protein